MQRKIEIADLDNNLIAPFEFIDKQYIEKIYFPLLSDDNKDIVSLFNSGDKILAGSKYGQIENPYIPLYSSVSGMVLGIELIYSYRLRRAINHLVIANDFLYNKISTLNKVAIKNTRKDILKAIEESGVFSYDENLNLYKKYSGNKDCEKLIIYDLDDKNLHPKMIEGVILLLKAGGFKKGYIYTKNEKIYNQLISEQKDNIKIELLTKKHRQIITYNAVLEHANIAYRLFEALLNGNPVSEIKIIVTGNGIREPKNIITLVGTLASHLIAKAKGYSGELINLVVNDNIKNKALLKDEFAIDQKVCRLLAIKFVESKISECTNCGACSLKCPIHLQPVELMKSYSNDKALQKLKLTECLECGKCSLSCPSNINVLSIIKQSKIRLKARQMADNIKNGGEKNAL